jgi:hypothetical protein
VTPAGTETITSGLKKLLHVSFRQVDLKEKVTAMVPVELVGEYGPQPRVFSSVDLEYRYTSYTQSLGERHLVLDRLSIAPDEVSERRL